MIPARDEEEALPAVLASLNDLGDLDMIVVDNASRDRTAAVARRAGATVIEQRRVGYGAACLAALAYLGSSSSDDVVVFLDADGSDDPRLVRMVAEPVQAGAADLVLASRALGRSERGALTLPQRLGNWLACRLIHLFWGVRYTDLAPCRAARLGVLRALALDDPGFGWNVQMQVRAARHGLCILELPSHYRRRRHGRSKISGTVSGAVRAGVGILITVLRERLATRHRGGHDAVRG